MIEALVVLAVVAFVALLLLGLTRLVRGPAGRGVVRRWAVCLLVALLAVGGGTWAITRSRSFGFFASHITRVNAEASLVALTFDDGPTPEYTPQVLDLLRREGVHATFFVTGEELEKHPELGRRIVAEGHELANHSYSHKRMVFMSLEEIRSEIARTDQLIRAAGYEGPIHFRPPYGKKLILLPYELFRQFRAMVLWDVEPDSDESASAEQIVAEVEKRVQPGSIVLLHVMYPSREASRQALPGVIAAVRAKGLEFVTITELLGTGTPSTRVRPPKRKE